MQKKLHYNSYKIGKRRLIVIGIVYSIIIFLLLVRLYYIQIIQKDFYTKEVNKQRQIKIPVDTGRGIIFDRNYIPLTDREEERKLILLPQLFIRNEENLDYIMSITNMDIKELARKINYSKYPIEFSIKDESVTDRVLKIRGLFIINKKQRYSDNPILTHILGYINQVDKRGMAGLEKAFDNILMGQPTQVLAITLDGRKHLIPGEGYSFVSSSKIKKDIRLTIDYHIQNIIEDVIDKHNKKGAIIVSDTSTGEILASVSRPNYNPNQLVEHLGSDGDELYNKAIQITSPPGSIFKIIIAAEAIEKNMIKLNETFNCRGYEMVNNVKIKCGSHKDQTDLELTFEDAFAQSCNSTFIQLGQRLDIEGIIDMAVKLGLGNKVGLGLLEEEAGILPQGDELLGPAIANISIGQGNIEVTPIQINQLTQIIANDGVRQRLYILDDILNDYETVETFNREKEARVLSRKTAKELQVLMQAVMVRGTGKGIGHLSKITAGKTGTAQTSRLGKPIQNAWFTGYYPSNLPKYAITIFIQEDGSGGDVAVPIFKDIVESIEYLDY